VQRLREGTFDEAAARGIAPVLHLGADQLVTLGKKTWRPKPVTVSGLVSFNTPFEDMTVNSYIAFDRASGEAVAFDTGADCSGMLELLAREKLTLKLILLTHTHGDHILELDRLEEKTGAPAFVGNREPIDGAETFAEGREFQCGALRIGTRLTWGHSPGGITYVITGWKSPWPSWAMPCSRVRWAAVEFPTPTLCARIASKSSRCPTTPFSAPATARLRPSARKKFTIRFSLPDRLVARKARDQRLRAAY